MIAESFIGFQLRMEVSGIDFEVSLMMLQHNDQSLNTSISGEISLFNIGEP